MLIVSLQACEGVMARMSLYSELIIPMVDGVTTYRELVSTQFTRVGPDNCVVETLMFCFVGRWHG